LQIELADVQVQGEPAVQQLVRAVEYFSRLADPPEVLVMIRGGGSADDLAAFSTEPVVRAVAASRVPTLVAIGHEVDVSLAELAADQRASTPSNAAELLVPDRRAVVATLEGLGDRLALDARQRVADCRRELRETAQDMQQAVARLLQDRRSRLQQTELLINALDPATALQRGFAIVRDTAGQVVRATSGIKPGDQVQVRLHQGSFKADVTNFE
jgi:exodeoxyribonuclease VII large subunit